MKKLHVLTFSFLCSIACAGMAFDGDSMLREGMVSPGVYDLSVISDAPPEEYIGISLEADGVFTLLDVYYPPGYIFYEYDYDYWGDGKYWWELIWNGSPSPLPSGLLLEMTFDFPHVVSEFNFVLWDSNSQVDFLPFIVAPEPTTLLLLGLGGLLIRKRK